MIFYLIKFQIFNISCLKFRFEILLFNDYYGLCNIFVQLKHIRSDMDIEYKPNIEQQMSSILILDCNLYHVIIYIYGCCLFLTKIQLLKKRFINDFIIFLLQNQNMIKQYNIKKSSPKCNFEWQTQDNSKFYA